MDEPRTVDAVDPDGDDSTERPRATHSESDLAVGRRDTAEAQMPDEETARTRALIYAIALLHDRIAVEAPDNQGNVTRHRNELTKILGQAEAGAAVPRDPLLGLIAKWRLEAAAGFPMTSRDLNRCATDLEEALKP